MILLLGGTGYVGTAFRELFDREGVAYQSISRRDFDYTNRDVLIDLIREYSAEFLLNAAGYTGKPNVDACEIYKADCLAGNALLPGVIREACEANELPWGHVSSGCIYTGDGPDGKGFDEEQPPNFCFRTNNCSFYSGCKALGEECLDGAEKNFIWRLRIPFNHVDSKRNYLSKMMRYDRLLQARNSISHLDEFVAACWKCWDQRIDYGIYNVTNTGSVTTSEVVGMIKTQLGQGKEYQFFDDEAQFMSQAAKTPRSNCVMDNSKLLAAGIHMSPVDEAIEKSLNAWQAETAV